MSPLRCRPFRRPSRSPCLRIESAGDYVRLRTAENVFLAHTLLAELQQQLDPGRFLRVHRTQIVNLDAMGSHGPCDPQGLSQSRAPSRG
jgi:hypothetical protein